MIMGTLTSALNRDSLDISASVVSAQMLGLMIKRIKDNTISSKIAKDVFDAMWNGEGDADTIIKKKGLKQVTDSGAIEKLVDKIMEENPEQVNQYRNSPPEKQNKLIGFFVGRVMKLSGGKANPQQVNEFLKNKLLHGDQ